MKKAEIIYKYFPGLSDRQVARFEALEDLYAEWNARINVISRKDIGELYLRHILHSLGIACVTGFGKGMDILDVGTGGGFPGIPLAIMFPEARFHLVDSIGKKITVVDNIARALELDNVIAEQIRAEQVSRKYDFILCRAVTRLKPFYQWVKGKTKKNDLSAPPREIKNGLLCLKGGDLDEELKASKMKYRVYELSDYFGEEYFQTKKVVYLPLG